MKLNIGDRVKFTAEGLRQFPRFRSLKTGRVATGEVVGYSRDKSDVRIRRDDVKTVENWPFDWWELETEPEPQPDLSPEAILTTCDHDPDTVCADCRKKAIEKAVQDTAKRCAEIAASFQTCENGDIVADAIKAEFAGKGE